MRAAIGIALGSRRPDLEGGKVVTQMALGRSLSTLGRSLSTLGRSLSTLGRSLSTICSVGRRRRRHQVWKDLVRHAWV